MGLRKVNKSHINPDNLFHVGAPDLVGHGALAKPDSYCYCTRWLLVE